MINRCIDLIYFILVQKNLILRLIKQTTNRRCVKLCYWFLESNFYILLFLIFIIGKKSTEYISS